MVRERSRKFRRLFDSKQGIFPGLDAMMRAKPGWTMAYMLRLLSLLLWAITLSGLVPGSVSPIFAQVSKASVTIETGDALAGYAFEWDASAPEAATFRRLPNYSDAFLPPGGKKPLGWLRLTSDTISHELTIHLKA